MTQCCCWRWTAPAAGCLWECVALPQPACQPAALAKFTRSYMQHLLPRILVACFSAAQSLVQTVAKALHMRTEPRHAASARCTDPKGAAQCSHWCPECIAMQTVSGSARDAPYPLIVTAWIDGYLVCARVFIAVASLAIYGAVHSSHLRAMHDVNDHARTTTDWRRLQSPACTASQTVELSTRCVQGSTAAGVG
jgi:hypothetical protein